MLKTELNINDELRIRTKVINSQIFLGLVNHKIDLLNTEMNPLTIKHHIKDIKHNTQNFITELNSLKRLMMSLKLIPYELV